MPRPRKRPDAAVWVAAVVCCAALGPAALHAALAAAAGTLFEAAPFVLAAELGPPRFGLVAMVAGCGCGRRAPGALSLPATALCWIAFGPVVALARLAAGFALLAFQRRRNRRDVASDAEPSDAFAELLMLGPCAALAVTLAGALGGVATHLDGSAASQAALFAAGLVLGAVAPCATAAVAIAAALEPVAGAAAAGILASGGFVSTGWYRRRKRSSPATPPPALRAVASRIALALALGTLSVRGAGGFVNPRLLPLAAGGAVLALVGLRRPTRSRRAALVPAILIAALAAGSPVPPDAANATRLDEAYAGERLAFVGRAHRSGDATVLERPIITCCRADASAVALRTSGRLPITDGTWIAATGVLLAAHDGLVLQPERWRIVVAPADPFLYR